MKVATTLVNLRPQNYRVAFVTVEGIIPVTKAEPMTLPDDNSDMLLPITSQKRFRSSL